jgi:xanthine dehydrogenase large subunit
MSIGKNTRHDSGVSHVTGASIFIDDRALTTNEVFVGIVPAPIACGKLKKINSKKALAHPDCLDVIDATEFAAKKWGTIVHEQPFLVEDEIRYRDEPVCLVVSSRRESLAELIGLVELEVIEKKGIFSIEDAKKKQKTIYKATPFVQGNAEKAIKESDFVLEGEFYCGGQDHFYLESQAAVVYPLENGQLEVHASSQHPSETQRVVAEACGLAFHKVVCIVKRMGGGFGGKESQSAPIAAYAGIVAQKFNRPARIILTKDEDMAITGKRHPFLNTYKVGFDKSGKINGLITHLQADGGAYADLSSSILERGMFHTDGAYFLENVEINGTVFRTNNHSNTAFRGFGGPQGNMTIESIIEDIAHTLGKDPYEIRRLNCYEGERNLTPYGQVVENNMLPQLFDRLYKSSNYQERLTDIIEHNKKKTGTLRGISMTATKFGIAFTAKFLNQGNALVNVQIDGTIQVSTGATEMGQGVNTKIQQIVAHAFGINIDDVQMMSTSTEKNHNTSATAASSGSDINGAAALAACNKIKKRLTALAKLKFDDYHFDVTQDLELDPHMDSDIVFLNSEVTQNSTGKKIAFNDLTLLAYLNQVSLGGYAHFKTPGIGFDAQKVKGKPFNYFTQGTVVTEVEIDEYTGEAKVRKVDILMDLGRPINPGIDKGQVTGAFVQGMGWVSTENLFYDKSRKLISHSPTTYKIPNVQDTPREFNVEFIENNDNECNVHRSKAVGEPPFLLGISVWTAIKHAISFRGKGVVKMTSPATNEEVLNALTERLEDI